MSEYVYPHIDPSDEAQVRGLELRDYFAAKAMQSYLCGDDRDSFEYADWARASYEMADAMLKVRKA